MRARSGNRYSRLECGCCSESSERKRASCAWMRHRNEFPRVKTRCRVSRWTRCEAAGARQIAIQMDKIRFVFPSLREKPCLNCHTFARIAPFSTSTLNRAHNASPESMAGGRIWLRRGDQEDDCTFRHKDGDRSFTGQERRLPCPTELKPEPEFPEC
jgi:hypothetical protein